MLLMLLSYKLNRIDQYYYRIEPNSNTASQIQSACNCATGCNHWVDLSTPPSNFPNSIYTLQNAELCVSPCQEVTSPQADAQCQVMIKRI